MKHRNILFSVIVIAAIAAVVMAAIPPPPANQNIGIKDTTLFTLTESECRGCHDSTTLGGVPTRHHSLLASGVINPSNGQPFGCSDCHPIVSGPNGYEALVERNCKSCHNGTTFYANPTGINLSKPHHIDTASDSAGIGQPAQNRQCDVCHGSFVANYNDSHYIPSYPTSFLITPYADYKANNTTTGKLWGGCRACHWNDTDDIKTNANTHHVIRGSGGLSGTRQTEKTPGETCSWCHVEKPDVAGSHGRVNETINGVITRVMEFRNSTKEQNDIVNGYLEPGTTNVTINGTGCEKCHGVQSIHNIQFDYANTNGQLGYGHIGNNWDCNGCHASWIAGAAPGQGAIIPTVDSITPSVVLAGSANSITITGVNFINDAYTSVVSVDGVTYTPASITDKQIAVNIPALNAGVHTLEVVKEDAKSKLATLTVVSQVDALNAKLDHRTITITGKEFGPQPTADFADLGVFVTHTATVKRKTTTTTFKATVVSWTNTQIVVSAGIAAVNDKLTVKTLNGADNINIARK